MAEKKGLFSKAGKLSAPEMRPQPRSRLAGLIADAMIGVRDFADRARVPESVPLLGGQGVGSLFLGRAPEEVNELSYGNSPFQINPYAGRTGSYVPEMKRGRGAQVFDALSLLSVPGARTVAGGLFGGGLTPGVDAAATVFHGSPYRFDRFDSSKIGTGEGAQAYGHGLYLADSPAVAGGYKDRLSNDYVKPDGGLEHYGDAWNRAFDAVQSVKLLPQDHARAIASQVQAWVDSGKQAKTFLRYNEPPAGYEDSYAAAVNSFAGLRKNPGQLYKVDLPDEAIAKMLDYDKPLSQQAPEVLDAMRKAAGAGRYMNIGGARYFIEPPPAWMMGGAAYARVGRLLDQGDAAASDALRQAGIPGIRYLDGGSRGQGQGSSNYVVFPGNESLLTILERNGQVVNPIYRDPMGDTLADTIR